MKTLSFSDLKVELYDSTIGELGEFIKANHYSKSVARGAPYVFKLTNDSGDILGCIQMGIPVGRRVFQTYGYSKETLVELKRMVIHSKCPKNTGSWFISRCIKWLKQNTNLEAIISYADQEYGHSGTVYHASNFTYIGETKKPQAIRYRGKNLHLRTAYGKGRKLQKEVVLNALRAGKAKWVRLKPKHIFIYDLGA